MHTEREASREEKREKRLTAGKVLTLGKFDEGIMGVLATFL